MLRRPALLLVVLSLLLPTAAVAKELKRKPLKKLDVLGIELAAKGEYSDDMYKAVRKADRCLEADRNWLREQERPDPVPVTQLYELVAGAVVCWQGAEAKALKLGPEFEPATLWIQSRTRYIESFRSFLWGIVAKYDGEQAVTCRRLTTAMEEAAAMQAASMGLATKYTTEGAQALGAQADGEAAALGQMIADEFRHQKCAAP